MGHTVPAVFTYHFTCQTMCFMFSLSSGTFITFSHSRYLFKILSTDNSNMAILHALPFLLRQSLCVLVANIFTLKSVIDHGSGILLICKDSSHRHIVPKRLFLTVFCKLLLIVLLYGNIHSR